jgi:hypothetical protein
MWRRVHLFTMHVPVPVQLDNVDDADFSGGSWFGGTGMAGL